MNRYLKRLFLLLIVPACLWSGILTSENRAKLSPALQTLMEETNLKNPSCAVNQISGVQVDFSSEGDVLYPITIRSSDISRVKAAGIQTNSDYDNWSTARVKYDQLVQLAELDAVTDIFQGDLFYPLNDLAVSLSGADLVHDAYLNNIAYDGTGVIVLIIDTGIDYTHLDFRDISDTDSSRILYIWDQTATTGNTPQDRDSDHFSGLNYGVEYTKSDIEDEIDGSPAGVVLEKDTNGHGTAVAGAAVGNGASLSNRKYKGMAPGADIVVVKAGENSFSDNNIKNALAYAKGIAETSEKPVVVNLSLGNQSNAHDGTSTLDEAVDDFVASGNGRVAVVAAGNAGNENIHISNSSVAKNATESISITVPDTAAGDSFEFELWWNNNGDVTAEVESPGNTFSYTITAAQAAGKSADDNDGTIEISNGTDPDHSNGDRRIKVVVSDGEGSNGLKMGDWTVKLTNNSTSAMSYHAWLYASSMGATVSGGDTTYTIASPGTASSAITVGSYSARWRYRDSGGTAQSGGAPDLSDDIAYFSSIGPKRGGEQKPDICASGLGVITATSTDYSPEGKYEIIADKYHFVQGSSISAGVVSGGVALLLDYQSTLSAATIKSKLTGNATADSYVEPAPNFEWGYGKLNIFESLAKTINSSATVNHDIYAYDTWNAYASLNVGSNHKMSLRFSPGTSGDITGAFFHTGSNNGSSRNVSFEIWSNSGTDPGARIGSNTVTMAVSDIAKDSWNYVSLKDLDVSVTGGTDYHLVCINTADDDLKLLVENGQNNGRSHERSSSASTWSAMYNYHMRPVVSTDESTLDSSLPVELAYFQAGTERSRLILKWATESEFENLGFEVSRRISQTNDWTLLADYTTHPELKGQGSTTSRHSYSYVDDTAKPGVRYDYRLTDISYATAARPTLIVLEDVQLMIDEFKLFATYPNPFNPSTHIAYQIGEQTDTHIRIMDIQGREIRSWEAKSLEPGYHEIFWKGLDSGGKPVGAGIYIVSIQAGQEIQTQKMVLIK